MTIRLNTASRIASLKSRSEATIGKGISTGKLAEYALIKGASQKLNELRLFIRRIRRRNLHVIVEIGSQRGGMFWLWCQLANRNATIVSIDPNTTSKRQAKLHRYCYKTQRAYFIKTPTQSMRTMDELLRVLGDQPIDLLYLNRGISNRLISREFDLYSQLVRPGGIVAIHNIRPQGLDRISPVAKFWGGIKHQNNCKEILDLKGNSLLDNWGGIGILIKERNPDTFFPF